MKSLKPLLIGVIITVSIFACKKELLDIKFAFPETPIVLTLESEITDTIVAITYSKAINLDSLAKLKNTSANKLKSITPHTFKFELLNPSTGNFDNFKNGTITISSVGTTPSTVGTFTTSNINTNAKTFDVTASGIDVLPFVKNGTFTLSCKIITKGAPTKPFTVKISMLSEAVANPSN